MNGMKIALLTVFGLFSGYLYSQQNHDTMDNQTIVETFLHGFNDPTKIPGSLALLADNYKFSNPMVDLRSKAEFIGLAQEIGKVVTGVELISIAENGSWVGTLLCV